jgi:type I restriction enzyme S subunit
VNTWPEVRLGRILWLVERTGFPDAELLSVYREHGVVRKRDRADNFNKPGMDLGRYQLVARHDLVINRMKAWQGSLGVSPYDGIVSPDYYVAALDQGVVDPRFFHHLVRSAPLIAAFGAASTGIRSNQWRLPWTGLRAITVRLPATSLQHMIAGFLDRECERIAALSSAMHRNSSQLDALRNACVREVTATLRHAPLKYCASVIDCKHRTAEYLDSGLPLVSTREVTRGSLQVDNETRRVGPADFADLRDGGRDPRRGDIIYSRNASVGVAAYLADDVDVCMGQDVVLITRRPRDCELLNYVLNWGVVDQVERLSIGSTFSRINVATIRQLLVPNDSPSREAEALAAIQREFLRLASFEQTAHVFGARLNEYRDSLIVEAATGQLDVTAVSDAQMDERAHAAAEGAVAVDRTPARVG